jgi:HPt (histidine-containing phosphotransfer) domain-containing protein
MLTNWNFSLKRKLQVIIMVTVGAALVLASAAFLTYDLITFGSSMRGDLETLAEILGSNSTAALTFGDQKAANEHLSGLKANRHIMTACLYAADGKPFGRYRRAGLSQELAVPPAEPDDSKFTYGRLALFRGILLYDQPVGTVYLESELEEIQTRLTRFAGIVAVVLLVSSLFAFLLSSQLQGVISKPILQLASTARIVSAEKDYSVRAVKRSDDEVGRLIDGFNEMLTQIQLRDEELQRHRDHNKELFEAIKAFFPTQESSGTEDGGTNAEPGVLDKSGLLARIEGDEELLKTLVDTFLEVSPGNMDKIREAIAGGDPRTVERATHFLKGSLGTLSASNAFRTAADLEQVARSGNLASAPEVYRTLEQDVALVREALQKVVEETDRAGPCV